MSGATGSNGITIAQVQHSHSAMNYASQPSQSFPHSRLTKASQRLSSRCCLPRAPPFTLLPNDSHLYETKQHIIIDCELQVRNESKPEVAGQVLAFSLLLVLNFLNAELRSFGCEIVVGDALDTAR